MPTFKTRLVRGPAKAFGVRAVAEAASQGYMAADIAKLYGYPAAGITQQWVAILELGGGYSLADIQAYCAKAKVPVPPIKEISIGGVTNAYTGNPNSADGEVALDIQNVIGATGGKVGIIMIFCPNTESGFAAGIQAAANDGTACALSISWGLEERGWSAQGIMAMDAAFQACAAKGISCFAASGDDGSADGGPGNNVDFPASSPYCIGCGGTTLTTTPESAWSYGGGGVSVDFKKPTWQTIGGTGRGVPDVAADADNVSGYQVIINGQWYTFGGTSAVSPMWSALIALIVSNTGNKVGFFLSSLYANMDTTDITTGSNGAYKAGPGWDPCCGCGVPSPKFVARMLGTVPPPNPPPPNPPPAPPPSAQHTLSFSGPYTIT